MVQKLKIAKAINILWVNFWETIDHFLLEYDSKYITLDWNRYFLNNLINK
jgi:hypothetical protein